MGSTATDRRNVPDGVGARELVLELQPLDDALGERAREQHVQLRVEELPVADRVPGLHERVGHRERSGVRRHHLEQRPRLVARDLELRGEDAEGEAAKGGGGEEDPPAPQQLRVVAELELARREGTLGLERDALGHRPFVLRQDLVAGRERHVLRAALADRVEVGLDLAAGAPHDHVPGAGAAARGVDEPPEREPVVERIAARAHDPRRDAHPGLRLRGDRVARAQGQGQLREILRRRRRAREPHRRAGASRRGAHRSRARRSGGPRPPVRGRRRRGARR